MRPLIAGILAVVILFPCVSAAPVELIVKPEKITVNGKETEVFNPGVWAYHCHIIYHLVNGMFTVVKYHGADTTFWQPEKAADELKELLP